MVKDAPIGAASLFALAIVALFCLLFQLLLGAAAASVGRWVAAFLIIVAYLLFSPAVAGTLYSVLFERPKGLGLAALAVAGFTVLTMRLAMSESLILLDGLILLPFWFLGIMGVVKFVRWRAKRNPANVVGEKSPSR
ncbi:MAG: hypothetical protein WA463_02030 [Terriglobales bacterium]